MPKGPSAAYGVPSVGLPAQGPSASSSSGQGQAQVSHVDISTPRKIFQPCVVNNEDQGESNFVNQYTHDEIKKIEELDTFMEKQNEFFNNKMTN